MQKTNISKQAKLKGDFQTKLIEKTKAEPKKYKEAKIPSPKITTPSDLNA